MKDSMTMAYINMFAVLGTIPYLCEYDEEARKLIEKDKVSVGFAVRGGGPAATLHFDNGVCRMEQGTANCQIMLPFGTPEKFNGMIDGTVTPIPTKGYTKLGFLLKRFMPLTDRLSKYLRPDKSDLEAPTFFETSTKLMFHLIVEAMTQIGNHDAIGKHSASYIVDGVAKIGIADVMAAGIQAKDHVLSAEHSTPVEFMSYMEFSDIKLARQLFDGEVNAVTAVGMGQVRIGGMISMVDNLNRILDRVALYLA